MRTLPLFLLTCATMLAQKPTIFLITDAEGVGGVCRQDQTEPTNQEMRQLLTGEINAAVDGFLEGGAGEVLVWDGHDGSQTLSTLTIHPKAKLLMGAMGPSMMMERHFWPSRMSASTARPTYAAGSWRTATVRWEFRICCSTASRSARSM